MKVLPTSVRPSVLSFYVKAKKPVFIIFVMWIKLLAFFLLRAGRIGILQSYPRSSVRFWKNIARVYGFFLSTLAVFPASRTTVVAAINPNYLGLKLCLHYTRELCADRKIIPDRASFCSHLRMIKNVCGGAISMTAGAKTMISKVERHISDIFCASLWSRTCAVPGRF